MDKVIRGQTKEIKVEIGDYDRKPMSRLVSENSRGYSKLSPDTSPLHSTYSHNVRNHASYRQTRPSHDAKSRPLLFTIFGWFFSIFASLLIMFVLALMGFLLYETLVRENMRVKKVNKVLLRTTMMSSLTSTTEAPDIDIEME